MTVTSTGEGVDICQHNHAEYSFCEFGQSSAHAGHVYFTLNGFTGIIQTLLNVARHDRIDIDVAAIEKELNLYKKFVK